MFFSCSLLDFFYLKNYLISSPWRVWTRYSFSPSSRRYDDKGDDDHRHHHPVNEIMKEWWTRLNVFVTNEIHFQEETRFPAHAAVVAARSTWLRTQLLRARERLQVRINFVFVFLYFSSSDTEQYDFLSSALFLHDTWNSFFSLKCVYVNFWLLLSWCSRTFAIRTCLHYGQFFSWSQIPLSEKLTWYGHFYPMDSSFGLSLVSSRLLLLKLTLTREVRGMMGKRKEESLFLSLFQLPIIPFAPDAVIVSRDRFVTAYK